MTVEEFRSFKRSVAIDAVRLNRGKMSQEDYYETLVATFGKDIFEEVIKVMDEEKPK
jgi:predicted secreted protein